jgi:CRISPR-associated endonuclease/helicase Cas3
LRVDLSFSDPDVVLPDGKSFASRLGARDLLVVFEPAVRGAFGIDVTQIALPNHWARGIDATADLAPAVSDVADGALRFTIQGVAFEYGARGLGRSRQ